MEERLLNISLARFIDSLRSLAGSMLTPAVIIILRFTGEME
jgi:hypothetical protein